MPRICLLSISLLAAGPLLAGVAAVAAAPEHPVRAAVAHELPPTRQQLIGAWRLIATEYVGPKGETVDPFYQEGSTGIIIYAPSGWMSVQIAGPKRRIWEVPTVRVPPPAEEDTHAQADAFDTYYSYFGTWDYDAAQAVVTHHVRASLIAAETGMNYAQTVEIRGERLVFTVRSGDPGTQTLRRKVWQKLTAKDARTRSDGD